MLALKTLWEKAQGSRRNDLQWIWEYYQAQTDQVIVADTTLRSYEGQYGPVHIAMKDGELHILIPGQSEPQPLSAVSETEFVVHGDESIRGEFAKDERGMVVGLDVIRSNGATRRLSKVE